MNNFRKGLLNGFGLFNKYPKISYPEHIPTSTFQKKLLAFGAASILFAQPTRSGITKQQIRLLKNFTRLPNTKSENLKDFNSVFPERTFFNIYLVFLYGEVTGEEALKKMRLRMLRDEVGRQILREKPRLGPKELDVEKLIQYPKETLGYTYAKFMIDNVQFVDDVDLAYVKQRYREIHDFVHVVSGMPDVSVFSELAVKIFEYMQTGLPLCKLAPFLSVRLPSNERKHFVKTYVPWALYSGMRCKFIMNIYFEKLLDQNLDDLAKEWDLIRAPSTLSTLGYIPFHRDKFVFPHLNLDDFTVSSSNDA